jgi:hypothetical protein
MKKSIKILIAVLLLLPVFSCKSQDKHSTHPPEKFSVVEGKLSNGKQVVGSINMAYKDYKEKYKYPWYLELNIALELKNVTANGLPTTEESNIANKFEDELFNEISKITTSHYIGHLYNDSFLDVYIYLDDPKKVHEYLQTQVNKKGITRGFAYKITNDPLWTNVNSLFK